MRSAALLALALSSCNNWYVSSFQISSIKPSSGWHHRPFITRHSAFTSIDHCSNRKSMTMSVGGESSSQRKPSASSSPSSLGAAPDGYQGTYTVDKEVEEEMKIEGNLSSTSAAVLEGEEAIQVAAAASGAAGGGIVEKTMGDIFSLWKRRLWTKADYLHSHAISGTAFMVLGALYVIYYVLDEVVGGGALAKSEAGVVGWIPLAILWTGVVNCISCLPMSKFNKGPGGDYDTKGAGFKGLGIGMTMLGVWMSYFFSGHYPEILAPIDPILAVGFLSVIIHGIINSEVALSKELAEKAPMMMEAGEWKGGPGQTAETRTEIILNHRVASYPNLLHLPVLYNIIVGGQAWAHKVMERFPLEPTLLFHASFGIAVANSIVFLGATLKDRKLMTLRQWLLLQVVVLTPFVTTIADITTLGNAVSINPFETYAGLMP